MAELQCGPTDVKFYISYKINSDSKVPFSMEKTRAISFLSGWWELRGLPYMTTAKCSDILTLPLVTVINQLILFISSAFWGTPSPTHCGRHIWKPLTLTFIPFKSGSLSFVSVRSVFPPQHEKITLGRKRKRIQVQSDDPTMLGDVQKVSLYDII